MVVTLMTVNAQTALKKVYDESIDPMEQIDKALAVAKSDGKFVVCQVGGGHCEADWEKQVPMFMDFLWMNR